MSLDIGLLILRVALGFILFAHATQKAIGWFHGPGMDKATVLFEALNQHPARQMAIVAITSELFAAILLTAGIATPLGVAVGASTMLVAAAALNLKAQARWNSAGGGEYPAVLAIAIAALGFTGPGTLSVDASLGWPSANADIRLGVATTVVALAGATVPIALTSRAIRLSKRQHVETRR
ncbi:MULTISPECIES: DoxX family protein [Mycobacteriaceae]|jgi:putative oxidoreductase|uniref:DoxX family protein n=1 Tax=Mycolicibacter arupensis TaxID=342002 RepID=A0A5C7XZ02_9MYCO|nr:MULTISPECIES: DoxX family protein [Mycobacteriaceae]MDM2351368.1 DoxX family protein [Mycobacteroides abscessus]MDM2361477.1 DoxX family protein [Mycobacteroides abscessus]TXI54825.1 MAG: DoxX family protein [Mycolicibacter arupensis]CPS29483.1 DoxX family protein [Mycobacteroides abscessus]CPV13818.1 DoxX family protein [Mycobacteroides abscessus]